MTISEWLRQRVQQRVTGPVGDKTESFTELSRIRWSPLFEQLMRNRLLMGYFRYGPFNGVPRDNCAYAMQKLRSYQKYGNLEDLVDAANMCLVEFLESKHPNRHFNATDDSIDHCKETRL